MRVPRRNAEQKENDRTIRNIPYLIIIRFESVFIAGHVHVLDLLGEGAFLFEVPLEGRATAAHFASHAVVWTH